MLQGGITTFKSQQNYRQGVPKIGSCKLRILNKLGFQKISFEARVWLLKSNNRAKSEHAAGRDAKGIAVRKLFAADVEGVKSVRAVRAVFE